MEEMGKKTRSRNPRNFEFREEIRRRPPQPDLRLPFLLATKRGDVLGEEAIRILVENGYDAIVCDGTFSDDNHTCVWFVTSIVQQRNATKLAPYSAPWQSLKRGPFVVFLRRRQKKDFAAAIVSAAERYVLWGLGLPKGQLAPFSVKYTSLTDEKRRVFETWRRSVGEAVGIPARDTDLLLDGLRSAVARASLAKE